MTTIKQINRTGRVGFGDASIHISEDGISAARAAGGYEAVQAWELKFKREVFTRIVQTLNRLGWTCSVPPKEEKQNSASFALNFRNCSKGDLKGELSIMGRSITLKMWQGVNTPTRSDHGGKYERDLEGCMPYVLRLEMERTRRRIRDYMCNVFTDYAFDPPRDPPMGLMGVTAEEKAAHNRRTSGHYRPQLDRAEISMTSNAKARDGGTIEHGARVWTLDHKGRVITGTAYYSLNSQWQIVTGRYGLTYASTESIFTSPPENLRVKRNQEASRKRLERLMKEAVATMDFKRAQVLKDVLFPTGPLYAIWHKGKHVYFGVMYCGYRDSIEAAGRYTRAELKPYLGDKLEVERFKAVLIA